MPLNILSLPDEVLRRVFCELDFQTIYTLFQMEEINYILPDHFTVVTSSKLEFQLKFPSIPESIVQSISQFKSDETKSWITLYYLDTRNQTYNCSWNKIEENKNHFLLVTLGNLDPPVQYSNTKLFSSELRYILERISRCPLLQIFTFQNMTEAELSFIKLDPYILNFPKLTRVKFISCISACEGLKFKFPNLQSLTLVDDYESIMKSLDLGSHPLSIVTMHSTRDMVLDDVIFSEASTELYIEMEVKSSDNFLPSSTVQNVVLPKVKKLEVFGVENLNNIFAPELEKLVISLPYKICTVTNINLKNLKAHNLKHIEVRNATLTIENLLIPTLEVFEPSNAKVVSNDVKLKAKQIKLFMGFHESFDPTEWFAIIDLETVEYLKMNLKPQNLEGLAKLNTINFPNLKIAEFPDCVHYESIVNLSAPQLESLRFAYAPINLTTLKGLLNHYKGLKRLYLHNSRQLTELKGIQNDSLEMLEIYSKDKASFGVDKCVFSKLKKLVINTDTYTHSTIYSQGVKFTAPELTTFHAKILLSEIDLKQFAKLKDVAIYGPEIIDLGNAENLEVLRIQSDVLKELRLNPNLSSNLREFEIRPSPEKGTEIIERLSKAVHGKYKRTE